MSLIRKSYLRTINLLNLQLVISPTTSLNALWNVSKVYKHPINHISI